MYDAAKIEKKWQEIWEKKKIYTAKNKSDKEKRYILIEFPYPSGEGLHMGHLRPYVAGDVYSRFLRMKGYEVMYPIGWDAFGLPAENFAIKKGIHPSIATRNNIKNAKVQLKSWGMSFDWSREVDTTDPSYYKWTQWIFLQFLKSGLAYKSKGLINWCPKDKTGLANEEVIDGCCERCGAKVKKKEMLQWYLKITAYAEKLLKGLEKLNWPEQIKIQQENWIGKSEGAKVKFKVKSEKLKINDYIEVYTTRPDTLFGATYMVISPEHPLVEKITGKNQKEKVRHYIANTYFKTEIERTNLERDKTGVFTGAYATNPVNEEKIPIWISDYVLMSYGTGAIMAVPAHDNRDFEFAKKFNLPIKKVVEEGLLVDSGEFTGMESADGRAKIIKWLKERGLGDFSTQYKMRDWVFSRQRYWGEPIPVIHCSKCGTVPVPEKDLPVILPKVKKYKPTGTGESPLAAIKSWVNVKCPECGSPAKRETNTMPQWAGSSWYYLRYVDPKNKKEFAGEKLMKNWLPVDVYFGGLEHTTLHLLYSRFWHQFLYDKKFVPTPEPYIKRIPHGIILGPDGEKMSKSRGNIVNPDVIVKKFGADCLRMYELFLGPHETTVSWKNEGILGIKRFLDRIYAKFFSLREIWQSQTILKNSDNLQILLHRTIKKVGDGIENTRFNTAISALMVLFNEFDKEEISIEEYRTFLKLLAPFAPHFAEELWAVIGSRKSIYFEMWPEYDSKLIEAGEYDLVIQINGKMRDKIKISKKLGKLEVENIVLKREAVLKYIGGAQIKKIIFIPNRIINVVL